MAPMNSTFSVQNQFRYLCLWQRRAHAGAQEWVCRALCSGLERAEWFHHPERRVHEDAGQRGRGRMTAALGGHPHCLASLQWPSITQHTPGHRAEAAIPARRLPPWTAWLTLRTSKSTRALGKGNKRRCRDQLGQRALMLGTPHAGPQVWILVQSLTSQIPRPL